ncbi:hypothetical protein [Enterococcus rivorum]|nr:hypothetical protein [Enterococcus rivorum]MBP2098388.1 hypothetical protein [Enterococcus rivorum]
MENKTKEKIFAERQDYYKQEKEQIFREALAQRSDENTGETELDEEE